MRVRNVNQGVEVSASRGALFLGTVALYAIQLVAFVISLTAQIWVFLGGVTAVLCLAVYLLMRVDVRIRFDSRGVRVDSGLRTHELAWEELEYVGIYPRASQVQVQARGKYGESFSIPEYWQLSATKSTRATAERVHQRVADLSQGHAVSVVYDQEWPTLNVAARTPMKGRRRRLTSGAMAILFAGVGVALLVLAGRLAYGDVV